MFLRLASQSLLDRKGSIVLTIFAISVSIFVLLGIEHVRQKAKESFGNTVSGTDLIVGARTSNLNLLLYSVFRIGNATNNIRWETYQEVAAHPSVEWTIPISLGDSHRGYRVMGTSQDYFKYFKYGAKRELEFKHGNQFEALYDVVLGAEVAARLGYKLGDSLILSHGLVSTDFSDHSDSPFKVSGILKATGTPVDQTLHVSLEAIEAIHDGWQESPNPINATDGFRNDGAATSPDLQPESITAFLIGLKSKITTFRLQRQINEYPREPLLAILPGVTLTEFWQTLSTTETTLRLISSLVLVAALLGLSALLLASIRERQQEIRIMRMLGASPWFIFLLIELEAILVTLISSTIAVCMLFLTLLLSGDYIASRFGLRIDANFLTQSNLLTLLIIFGCSILVSFIPSISAYRRAH